MGGNGKTRTRNARAAIAQARFAERGSAPCGTADGASGETFETFSACMGRIGKAGTRNARACVTQARSAKRRGAPCGTADSTSGETFKTIHALGRTQTGNA